MNQMLEGWIRAICGTKAAFPLASIAIAFYLWPPRRIRMKSYDQQIKRAPRRSYFSVTQAFAREFLDEFLSQHLEWSTEDADAALTAINTHCKSLADWFYLFSRLYGISLKYDAGEPYIAMDDALTWSAIANQLDPDAIVLFLIGQTPFPRTGEVGLASPIMRIADRDLNSILERGLTDYHLHMGGIRSAQALWRNILNGRQSLSGLRRYSPSMLASLGEDEARRRNTECAAIEEIISDFAARRGALAAHWCLNDPGLFADDNRARINAELAQERAMCSLAWRDLFASQRDQLAKTGVANLEDELDRYIFTKSNFLSHHRQPDVTNPGLGMFRNYFRSTDPSWPTGKLVPSRFERSPRLLAQAWSEYAAHIAQSAALRRVELRIAPLDTPRDYHRFFEIWKSVETEFEFRRRNLEVGFAVHFKRSIDQGGKQQALHQGEYLQRFLASLDRDTAALHAFRHSASEHVGRIVRIDLAGAERDLPPSYASFCLNLVRGAPDALEALKGCNLNADIHRCWLWHLDQGTAAQPYGRPNLGQSCHAGEDFAHPLEGLYCVASAVDCLHMRDGDTIGHGAALAADPDVFDVGRSSRMWTVRGHQFDALFWLYRCIRECDIPCNSSAALAALEAWLIKEFVELYPVVRGKGLHLHQFDNLDVFRRGVVSSAPINRFSLRRMDNECLQRLEYFDQVCAARRSERVPVATIVGQFSGEITALQRRWIDTLAERGIVLEFNPSSNLRVGASNRLEDVPFVALLEKMRDRILATINTDNPGVFSTRIENEYAFALQALANRGVPRAERIAIAERLREVGASFVYWPLEAGARNGRVT